MAGTLDPVSDADHTVRERDYYRIGRHFFDGADAQWVAARENITETDALEAWEFCREKLSNFFAAATGEEIRLLSDAQLHARSEDCVRLLLHWHETLWANERLAKALRSKTDQAIDEQD